MRILLVKTSSLGDVIHNLPVLGDIFRHRQDVSVDWCVEENFAAIPRLHPRLSRVVPVAIRHWRSRLFSRQTWRDIAYSRARLREEKYDFVIDTQGLVKSALVAALARGPVSGYDAGSIREPLAVKFYRHTFAVSRAEHAVTRNRLLAGAVLGYAPEGPPDYGIAAPRLKAAWLPGRPYAIFLTGTSRDDKLWPEQHWISLGKILDSFGMSVVLPAGNPPERERAARIAQAAPGAVAAPELNLDQVAGLIAQATLAVGVDTGLTHLAVALKVPTVALYVATDPGLTGVLGQGYARNLGRAGSPPAVGEVVAALPEGGW